MKNVNDFGGLDITKYLLVVFFKRMKTNPPNLMTRMSLTAKKSKNK